MSDETTPPFSQRLASHLRFSIAGYATICMGVGLILLTLVTWFVFNSEPQRVAWGDYVRWPQMLFLLGLMGLICFLTYWTVRLWNEDLPVRERNLELAWQAGIEGLRKRGAAISELPLFLVIGCQNEKSQENFLLQAGLRLAAEPIPKASSSPLRWYLADDRILLFLSDVGTFSATQSRLSLHRQEELAAYHSSMERLSRGLTNTRSIENPAFSNASASDAINRRRMDTSESRSIPVSSFIGSAPSGATPTSNSNAGPMEAASQWSEAASHRTSKTSDDQVLESLEATEQLLVDFETESDSDSAEISSYSNAQPRQNPLSVLSSKEMVRQQTLLEDTCRRLKVARQNTAPVNGILAWVDGPQLMDCTRLSRQCGLALRRDSLQIQEHLGVNAPVTVVLDRMQELHGFSELIRRMGHERSSTATLGDAFELQRLPDLPAIQSSCRRSLTEITAAIYRSFRTANGLGQPGNHKLFQLLVACRGKLGPALESFLMEALAIQPHLQTPQEPALFSGVYFTASGEAPTQRGFSNSLLARILDQQEFLCWTKQRMNQEHRYRLAAWVLSGLCLILTVALIGQLLSAAW